MPRMHFSHPTPHHRFMLSSLLRQYEFLSEEIAALDLEVAERMRPFAAALRLLDQVPGIRQASRRGHHRGAGQGYDPLADPCPPRLLGQDVPGQQSERREESHRTHRKG